jgi:anti-sigma factor RsiW
MNCSRARQWIPLYAGADLAPRKAGRLEKHLENCADCRTEYKEIRAAMAGFRALADRDTLDWPEAEWKGLMARVTAEKPEPRPVSPLGTIRGKAWAYGFAAVLFMGIVGLVLKSILSPPAAALLSEVVMATPALAARTLERERLASGPSPRELPFEVRREQAALDRATLAAGTAPGQPAQDILVMTLVSQETGLRVHWTFNKNFEWEEKKQ